MNQNKQRINTIKKKKPNSNDINQHLDHNKEEIIKKKLIEKYDISDEDLEIILKKIENKHEEQKNNGFQKTNSQQKITTTNLNKKSTSGTNIDTQSNLNNIKKKYQSDNTSTLMKDQNANQDLHKQNIDNIMSDIVYDYDKQLSIEVKNLDLTFEVETDKIDTIKESFIRTVKRNKSKKIKIHALKDISFKLYKGEKIGIIGYNGAGKSTLLKVICGIYPPDNGTVETYGNISPLLGLGAGFDVNFSGRKNIMLNGAVLGYEKEFVEKKMDEIIEFSELGEYIDLPIKNYSSGMKAKLAFSIATIVEPDILIIDEVLGVGDINFAKKSRDKMRYLMDGGTTVLLVSHSIQQIKDICDKAIWIDNGKLKEIGEVNEVCNHYIKDAEKATQEQTKNIQFRE